MAITTKPQGSPSIPNSKTTESAASPAVPNSKTTEASVSPAVPNSKTTESVVNPAVPNAKTTEAAANPAVPNSLTVESAVSAAIPNSKTTLAAAATPRALIPLVSMDFASQCYSQNGNPVLFDDLFTYSRASTGTYIGRDVVNNKAVYSVKTAAIDEIRFSYDPETGEKLGALIEGASTNLLTRSEEFDHADWTKSASTLTVTDSGETVLNGSQKLYNLEPSAAGQSVNSPLFSIPGSVSTTFSVYIKNVGSGRTRLEIWDKTASSTTGYLEFHWLGGAPSTESSSGLTSDPIYKNMGDGLYRVSMSTTSGGANNHRAHIYPDMVGAGNVLASMAQVEELPFSSSYIKTEGSAVTRAVDDLTNPVASSAAGLGSDASYFANIDLISLPSGGSGSSRILFRNNGFNSTFSIMQVSSTGGLQVFHGASAPVIAAEGAFDSSDFVGFTFTASTNTIQGYIASTAALSGDAGRIYQPNNSEDSQLGGSPSLGNILYGHIKSLSAFDQALTAQEVALL